MEITDYILNDFHRRFGICLSREHFQAPPQPWWRKWL